MPIHFECPHCTFPFALPHEAEGTVIICSSCGEQIRVPEAPPAPLPPLERILSAQKIVGIRPFILLDALGIYTDWSAEPGVGEILRFIFSLFYSVLLLTVLLSVIKYTATPETADAAAPWYLGAVLATLLIAYLLAVNTVAQDEPRGPKAARRFSMYLFSPAVMVISEFRRALPVYRVLALALALIFTGSLVAHRAGGANTLLPPALRNMHLFPAAAPTTGQSDVPYNAAAPGTWPPPGAAASAPAPHADTRFYDPSNGPPPPPQ